LDEGFLRNIGTFSPSYKEDGELQLLDFFDSKNPTASRDAVIRRLNDMAMKISFDGVDKLILQESTEDEFRGARAIWTRGNNELRPSTSQMSIYDILRVSRSLGVDDYRDVTKFTLVFYDPTDRTLKLKADIDNFST